MNKKYLFRHLFAGALLSGVVVLSACNFQEDTYNFNGEKYTESELEEYLADLLEIENLDKDIEINIYTEDEEDD